MARTEYTARRPRDGHPFAVFDARLAEELVRDGWRVTAVTHA